MCSARPLPAPAGPSSSDEATTRSTSSPSRTSPACFEQAVTDPATRGRILEIGGPDNLSFNQLAAEIQQAAGRTAAPRHVPRLALRLMARSAGYLRPELGRQARAALVMDQADFSRDAAAAARVVQTGLIT